MRRGELWRSFNKDDAYADGLIKLAKIDGDVEALNTSGAGKATMELVEYQNKEQEMTMNKNEPCSGKVAFVTGGANGIGRATELAFAREGASVVVAWAWLSHAIVLNLSRYCCKVRFEALAEPVPRQALNRADSAEIHPRS